MKKNGICQFYNYTIGIKVRIKEFLNMTLTKSDVDVPYAMDRVAMIFYAMLVVVLFCLLIPPKTDVDLFTW